MAHAEICKLREVVLSHGGRDAEEAREHQDSYSVPQEGLSSFVICQILRGIHWQLRNGVISCSTHSLTSQETVGITRWIDK